MEVELLSHNKSAKIYSKHTKGVIANDKNDPSAAYCIVEGMDAIDDTIPLPFLQLATHLPPEPIYAVEKMEVVIRHPDQVGTRCPPDHDAPLHTSPPEPLPMEAKVTVSRGVNN
eukprot:scaffold16191_cov69-Skeletonema_dohrnii-CCMP3373.AAC.3